MPFVSNLPFESGIHADEVLSVCWSNHIRATLEVPVMDELIHDLHHDAFPETPLDTTFETSGMCWYVRSSLHAGKVVAALWIGQIDLSRRTFVFNVFTHSKYRRRGIMKCLLPMALQHVKQHQSVVALFLHVVGESTGAINLYFANGFHIVHRKSDGTYLMMHKIQNKQVGVCANQDPLVAIVAGAHQFASRILQGATQHIHGAWVQLTGQQ